MLHMPNTDAIAAWPNSSSLLDLARELAAAAQAQAAADRARLAELTRLRG
jgi:hypothetical protein